MNVEPRLSWLRTFRGYTEDEAELAAWAADEIERLQQTLELAFSMIACLPDGRPDSQATCAYVPRAVYDQIKEVLCDAE